MPVISTEGSTVRVYRFKLFDIATNEFVTSSRYATKETVDRLGGRVLGVPFLVPVSEVDEDGLTPKDYVPVQGTSA